MDALAVIMIGFGFLFLIGFLFFMIGIGILRWALSIDKIVKELELIRKALVNGERVWEKLKKAEKRRMKYAKAKSKD